MTSIITADFSKFGSRELRIAGELLAALAKGEGSFLGSGITVNFNTQSAYVFLNDEDYNTGIMVGGKLVQFFSCPNCGYESTQDDAKYDGKDFEKYKGACSKDCAIKCGIEIDEDFTEE